jgi:TetR/AcrR family transcriptional regulator, transcriptional repressor for nem operon
MKVSKAQASENRQAIVHAAAAQLRERGFEQMSVAEVARAAGLTHGALYSHFKSKDALAAEAISAAFAESAFDVPLGEFVAQYLSPTHRDHPGQGCPNAALASEIWRQPPAAQQAYRDGLEGFLRATGEPRDRAIALVATMVGGLVLARAIHAVDPEGSDEILRTVAAHIQG